MHLRSQSCVTKTSRRSAIYDYRLLEDRSQYDNPAANASPVADYYQRKRLYLTLHGPSTQKSVSALQQSAPLSLFAGALACLVPARAAEVVPGPAPAGGGCAAHGAARHVLRTSRGPQQQHRPLTVCWCMRRGSGRRSSPAPRSHSIRARLTAP
ncbi:hypothetical protein OBBRIDRAFT_891544 [Obba rivulosa]|uniref:Uncharacterized protein n=1 Tax=Obba rivulosa TaxID=1052685 RepID=A0A8E2AQG6_9APHY|nr:hypothetical protein OBBRIDRAFT_891544 [Obba rivulosa]